MNAFLHNPIADMPGPQFLGLYILAMIGTLFLCRFLVRQAAFGGESLPVEIPENPNPYEIAFLRGKAPEVSRLAVFRLIESGYLTQPVEGNKDPKIERTVTPPADPQDLPPQERAVYDFCNFARKPSEFFKADLQSRIKSVCEVQYQPALEEQRLLTTRAARSFAWPIGLTAFALMEGLAAYKVVAALLTQHFNIGFLITLGFIFLIALVVACQPPRLTARGREYLANLQTAFENLRRQFQTQAHHGRGELPLGMLAFGLFGATVLAGGGHAYFSTLFPKAAASGGVSSCGSGCGSCTSSGGGGDGGGGDGGGGGGGCGGGGGGCGGCGGGGGD